MRPLLHSAALVVVFASTFTALLFSFLDLWIVRGGPVDPTQWNPRVLIPVALLGAALLAMVGANLRSIADAAKSRRAYTALLFAANIAIAGGLLVLVNYLAVRHYRTFDWTTKGLYEISERTEVVLRKLPRPVTANIIGSPGHPYYQTVRSTLDMYRAASGGKLEIESFDPANDREKLLARLRALGVNPKEVADPNVVIFECPSGGAGAPRTKFVLFDAVVEREPSSGMGGEPRIKAFKAESEFTEAILSVTRDVKTKVVFLVGHEEVELFRRSDDGQLATLERTLRQLNYEVDSFGFDFAEGSGKADLPADTGVLVIAGPKGRFADKELERLKAFLDRGGRALVLGEPVVKTRPGTRSVFFDDVRLDALLKDYGIALEPSYLFDPSSQREFALATKVDDAASHPIVKPLQGSALLFYVAEGIIVTPPDPSTSKVKVESILETQASAIAVKDINGLERSQNPFGVEHRKGPITIAAVATKPVDPPTATAAVTGTASPDAPQEARLVVVSDATFTTDDLAESIVANLDFTLNCISWLASREEAIAIGSKKPEQIHLNLDGDQQTRVKLLALLILPIGCAMMGLAVFTGRRS